MRVKEPNEVMKYGVKCGIAGESSGGRTSANRDAASLLGFSGNGKPM